MAALKLHLFIAVAYGLLGAMIHQVTSTIPWTYGSLAILITCTLYSLVFSYSASQPKFILKNNYGAFTRKRMMEFDEDGFTTKLETGSHSYTVWPDVEMVTYQNQITNIYVTKLYIVQIPDNAWPSPAELRKFHDFLRKKSLIK